MCFACSVIFEVTTGEIRNKSKAGKKHCSCIVFSSFHLPALGFLSCGSKNADVVPLCTDAVYSCRAVSKDRVMQRNPIKVGPSDPEEYNLHVKNRKSTVGGEV